MRKMKRANEIVKRNLQGKYDSSCNSYRKALENMWGLSPKSGDWVGPTGSLYANGRILLRMEDMIYCVNHDIEQAEAEEWVEYNLSASEWGFDRISLPSWHDGAERQPKELFDRLRKLEKEFNE